MLEVTFFRDERARPSSVFARGHAEFAEFGEDIVCAAVSAILQAMRLGLETYGGPLDVRQGPGELRLAWREAVREDPSVEAIVTTAELSVEQIASQYPRHVKFSREHMDAEHLGHNSVSLDTGRDAAKE